MPAMRFQFTQTTLTELEQALGRIERAIYTPLAELSITAWMSKEPLPFDRRKEGTERSLRKGDAWGGLFDCAWFHFAGTVPQQAAGEDVVLILDLSGELLIVDRNGNPRQGLTTAASFYDFDLGKPGKRIYPFASPAEGGDTVDLWADGGNNDLFGVLQNNGTVQEASIAVRHAEMEALYYDFSVLLELMKQLDPKSARYQSILYALWKARNALTAATDEKASLAREALRPELERTAGDHPLRMSAIGHAHLDLAWLWPIRETIRKGARTFSTVLRLMERYGEYHFCASQAQLYEWMKDHYPALYAEVKERVREGRWEPLAATWVEPDTNLPWGEALVRQILYGKRFVQEEFGQDVGVLFLPDTFGYSGALPQLMKRSGIHAIVTTKLTWDRYNRYPHDSFWWEGIDGSRVLVHFPPEGTYNSSAAPRAIAKAEREYADRGVSSGCLLVYGIGDGGGGPGVEHLERLAREKNLLGLAPVTQEPVHQFVDRLAEEGDRLHTWVGEMYLACHQGTYTTQGRNKHHNRLMEKSLRQAELLSATAELLVGRPYPGEALRRLWKETLLYQFHDILPGSSITRVYEETGARYPVMEKESGEIAAEAFKSIASRVRTRELRRPLLVFNPLSWRRAEWMRVRDQWSRPELPSLGYAAIEGAEPAANVAGVAATETGLENDLLRLEFNDDGTIASMWDKEHRREVVPGGEAINRLRLYEDHGDAWDFAYDYRERLLGSFLLQSSRWMLDGPRVVREHTFQYGKSRLTQRIVLTAGSRRVDFETNVNWQESGTMLRAEFPVTVRANECTAALQFGSISRPTHGSTSWDASQYEIPAQQWVDLSGPDYGVALLKESKYGHHITQEALDVNLLRSPSYPDPVADRGEHEFTYCLFPHLGDSHQGRVLQAAYEFNYPPSALPAEIQEGTLPQITSLIDVDRANVIVESVKKAEDGPELIVRLYEAEGRLTDATVRFGVPVRSVTEVNLLEEPERGLAVIDGTTQVRFQPRAILTLRLER
jgi:alpha-mannosidase